MLTGDDIRRLEEEHNAVPQKLVVIETMQYFEIEIPADMDTDQFIASEDCRKQCADKILSQTTDLTLERVFTNYNEVTGEWT